MNTSVAGLTLFCLATAATSSTALADPKWYVGVSAESSSSDYSYDEKESAVLDVATPYDVITLGLLFGFGVED